MDRIRLLETYVENEPNDPFNYFALMMEYLSQNDRKQVKLLVEKLLSDFPEYLPTYYQAAHFLWESGDLDHAEEVFKKGILLAEKVNDPKTHSELKGALINFHFDRE